MCQPQGLACLTAPSLSGHTWLLLLGNLLQESQSAHPAPALLHGHLLQVLAHQQR